MVIQFVVCNVLLFVRIMLKTWRAIRSSKRSCSQSAGKCDPGPVLNAYSPIIEEQIRQKWRAQKTFSASGSGPAYSAILPPPNVTGTLHLGHALTVAVGDALCRWRRMQGYRVVWIPGTDHAGIATQSVVERDLMSQNLTRHDLGKDRFVDEVWKWKDSKGARILDQLGCLGASLDWSREYFTLDQVRSDAVTESLIKLWDAGLVYRADSLVNWCCHLRSAISDIEVDHVTIDGPTPLRVPGYDRPITFGQLDHFAYRVENSDDEIVVATTRLETMLGDVAVAVHPSDDRYSGLHGRLLVHPFSGCRIPVVLDESVDPKFGTGAVKVTPAHDATDFEVGKRHRLPAIAVISEDGTLCSNCGDFKGLKRFDAREALRTALANAGLFRKSEGHKTRIPICSRSSDVIEMIMKPQWFINCRGMADKAIEAVQKGELTITPDKYQKIWFSWLENIKDWCISRQLWWGHQVPFYQCSNGQDEIWLAAHDESDALTKASGKLAGNLRVTQDSDVIDTWFSSGLLPFSSLGWPQQSSDLKEFYPLSTLVTGHDILFFWVARMTMLGLELTGQLPFNHILLHSIVCDSQGRKMSKSLGNVIDPMDIINGCSLEDLNSKIKDSFQKGIISEHEADRARKLNVQMFPNGITECGTDALRFSLLSQNVQNHYINFNISECHGNKLFCNKIWQCHKFANLWAQKLDLPAGPMQTPPSSNELIDVWVLSRLSNMVDAVNTGLVNCNFHESTAALRSFMYGDLCDVYIEAIKPILNKPGSQPQITCSILLYCLDVSLRCLAPFMPYLSESLYSTLANRSHASLDSPSYPNNLNFKDLRVENKMDYAMDIVRFIRKLKSENGSTYSRAIVHILSRHPERLEGSLSIMNTLTRSDCLLLENHQPDSSSSIVLKGDVDTATRVHVMLELKVTEKTKLQSQLGDIKKKKEKIENELEKMRKMMSNEGYKKASEKSRKQHERKVLKLRADLERIESS